MIKLIDFSIGFGIRKLLDNVTTEFLSGKLTAIIGHNGAGKSTLMKALCGLNENYKGEILINGMNLKKIPRTELAKTISYVNTQRPRMANLKCSDVVELGRSPYTSWHGKISDRDRELIENSLRLVGMETYKSRYFNSLSDGECQKIMIARTIAQDTDIIILDEPTSFLDLPTRYELVALLKELCLKQGKTIIFSTHELDIALKFADYITLFDTPSLINLPAPEMIAYLKTSSHPFSCYF